MPNLSPQNLASVEIGKDFMLSHGYIKNDFDVQKWAAPEFLEQAAKELLEERWKKVTGDKLPAATALRRLADRIVAGRSACRQRMQVMRWSTGPSCRTSERTHHDENTTGLLRRYLPILEWGAEYSRQTFTNDLIVAAIVTVMLIPQSLAYALLAGLPPQVGLYASIAPLVLYAIFGTSRTLAVGPVAVASLMTAAAAGAIAAQGTPEYLGATVALAVISGLLLLAMGLLRLGFLANFLSHPVISGFITASGIQIAASQLAPVLGIKGEGENLVDVVKSLWSHLGQTNLYTAVIGFSSLAFLFWARSDLKPLLLRLRARRTHRGACWRRSGPPWPSPRPPRPYGALALAERGVRIVGTVPTGLPSLTLPPLDVGTLVQARCAGAADLHRGLCRVDLGRPDARRQAPAARRSGPGTDRAGRLEHRRRRLRRIPGHRRLRAFGG